MNDDDLRRLQLEEDIVVDGESFRLYCCVILQVFLKIIILVQLLRLFLLGFELLTDLIYIFSSCQCCLEI